MNLKRATFLLFAIVLFIGTFSLANGDEQSLSAQSIIAATNKARLKLGLRPLNKNLLLSEASELKNSDMAKEIYFAHFSPRGATPWGFISESGYAYTYAGENLAINYSNADKLVEAWLESPSHKKNILNPKYQDIGVSVSREKIGGRTYTFVVQMFGTPQTLSLK